MRLFLFGDTFKAIFTLHPITISSQNERLCGLPHSMNSNGKDQEQVPHSHQTTSGTFGREGLVNCLPALAPELPSQCNPVLSLLIHFRYGPNELSTLHQSVTQNLSDMWRVTFEISAGAAQIRSVTEIAPKSPFFLVYRIPMVIKSFYFSSNFGNGKKDTKATVFFRTLACVVSLAGVFCMSHNAPPKDPWRGLRNIQKTPARKTIACVADVI